MMKILPVAVLPLMISAIACAAGKDAIVPDRPDFVESTDVVGSKSFQLESGIATEKDHRDSERTRMFSTPFLLRYGVSDTVELRLESDGRIIQRSRDDATGTSQTQRGFADASIGMKWHVADAKGAMPSLALLLHADIDSGSKEFREQGVRPSIRMSAEWDLPADFSLGIMPGISREHTDNGAGFTSGQFGAVLGKAITDKLGSYIELAAPQIAKGRNGGAANAGNARRLPC